jgi:hypothetical protein
MARGFTKARYRKEVRTIHVRATDGDSGREKTDKDNYFRCWHCGFICDVRRDELSKDGRRGTTVGPETPLQSDRVTTYGMGADAIKLSTGAAHHSLLMEQDSTGSNKTVYRYQTAGVARGCPLCGTTVWKKP